MSLGFVLAELIDQCVGHGGSAMGQWLESVMVTVPRLGGVPGAGQRLPGEVGQHLPGGALLPRARSRTAAKTSSSTRSVVRIHLMLTHHIAGVSSRGDTDTARIPPCGGEHV